MVKLFKDHAVFVTVIIFGIGIVSSAAVGQYQIRQNWVAIEENAVYQRKETELLRSAQRQDHDSITRIEVDVRWIRESLEKQE